MKKCIVPFLLLISLAQPVFAQFKLYEKGHDSYTSKNYPKAIQYFSEYLTRETRDKAIDIDVFYLRGLSYFKSDKYNEAIPDFEETLLRGHTNKGNIYWFMAKCYANTGNVEETVNCYSNALRELKTSPESQVKLLLERGQAQAKQGNKDLAVADFNSGLALKPDHAELKKELQKLGVTALARQTNEVSKETANPTDQTQKKKETKKTTSPPVVTKPVAGDEQTAADNTKSNVQEPNNNESKPAEKTVTENKAPAVVPVTPAVPTLADLYKDEKRFALVIGNSNYPKEIGALRNPVNDATDIAEELRNSNFEVNLLTNATYGQIRAALMKFKEKMDGGDPEKTVALFYFAGHGLQYEDENYIVPIDASVEFQDDIVRYCFPVQRMVLSNMERSSTRMNIVILDACRNNPFPSVNRSLDNSGLGEMKRARGSFIAYATSPGSVASDGTGRNGLYTQELLKALKKPGLTIEQVFKDVRANVLKTTDNKQNTWDSSNIIGEFYFKF